MATAQATIQRDMTEKPERVFRDAQDVAVVAPELALVFQEPNQCWRFGGACGVFSPSPYPHQFTIRSKVASGVETELSKIVNGKGDWMFYGHSNVAQTVVDSWWLIDLRAFRAGLIRHSTNCLPIVMGDKTNADGTCFKWFDIRSFPAKPPLVVASSRVESFS